METSYSLRMTRRAFLLDGTAVIAIAAAEPKKRGWRIGRFLSDLLKPGYGNCLRCGTNWGFVEGHTIHLLDEDGTRVDEKPCWLMAQTCVSGMFPICEQCWGDTGVEEHVRFARQLYDRWLTDGAQNIPWERWERSVRADGSKI
jgi:hypothetical protein